MNAARRFTIIGMAATLCTIGALSMAPAAMATGPSTVITIDNASQYEYLPECSNTAPYPFEQCKQRRRLPRGDHETVAVRDTCIR